MPLSSVDAVQLTSPSVADCAAADTPVGTAGALVSGGGGCTGWLGGGEESSPPPQADSQSPSDSNAANEIFRAMQVPVFLFGGRVLTNLRRGDAGCRRTVVHGGWI